MSATNDADPVPVVIPTPRAHAPLALGWLHGADAPPAIRYYLVAAKTDERPKGELVSDLYARVGHVLSRLGVQDHGDDPIAALESWANEEHARCADETDEHNAVVTERDALRNVLTHAVIDFDAGEWTPVRTKVEATRSRVANGRRAFGRRFVMPYNGSGSGLTGRSLDRPIGTITAADRWGVVDGDRMRMLTVEEALAFQGFPRTYRVPATREHWTQAVGNAIPPVLAEAAMRAVMEAA